MDHECVDACNRDLRRAARMGKALHAHIDANLPANVLYRRIARAIDRTACVRARAQMRGQLELCACLVRGTENRRFDEGEDV